MTESEEFMTRLAQETDRALQLRQSLGPFARAILTKTPQGYFAVPVEDCYVGQDLRFSGGYSQTELNLIRAVCTDKSRILVLGAHIGTLAIPLAHVCESVVAVEANPETYELLKLNVTLNSVTNCKLINAVASNRSERLEFILNRVNSGGSKRVPVIKEPMYFHDNPKIVGVDAVVLDDLLAKEIFDVIIMDIEGSEYFALQGMQNMLAAANVMQIEFIPHHLKNVSAVSPNELLALIAPHFQCLRIVSKGLLVVRDQFANVLNAMYDRQEQDEGLIFMKSPPADWL
jgi:FkbM family methyltransferase